MEFVRMGIIGFGNMGTTHAKNIYEGKVPSMKLGAICDINSGKIKRAEELYPEAAVYSNATDMFKDGKVDAVIIAVPHYFHPGLAIEAFSYGLHVITEKPAGVYTKQVLEMNEAAKKSGKIFGIMYNQRTNPLYTKLREIIKRGDLGKIKRINWIITDWYRPQAYHDSAEWRSTWKDEGGGTLINQNPHQLDLWQWLFGMPDRITSFCSFGKYYDIEVEDDVTAFMEYENGVTGVYITSTGEAPGTNRLEIACDMGRIVTECNRGKWKMTFMRNVESEREFNKKNTSAFAVPESWECDISLRDDAGEQHVGILKNFTNAVLKGEKLLAPGEEGVLGLTISNAIHYSTWTGRGVNLKNFPHEEFYGILEEKIKNSKPKKSVRKANVNMEDSF